ncbi:hypothetical protein B0H19DRAFT_1326964 [Mycena capillaripes]|nr:hypothetical protein B0H19DRAFT_1326964 [Mycena capillaripes]
MNAVLSLTFADLLALTLGTLFYGMYCILFITSVYLLASRAENGNGARGYRYLMLFKTFMFVASCALFMAVTGHWVLNVRRCFQGFIFFADGTAPDIFLGNNAGAAVVIQNVFEALSLAIGDSIIIYRLWVVWPNFLVLILPILSLLGLITPHIATSNVGQDVAITPLTVFTLVTNFYCTGFIAFQIWRITKASVRGHGGIPLQKFLAIIVESAAIYTSYTLFYTITHQLNLPLQFGALNSLPPVLGIANALIYTQLALGKATVHPSRVPSHVTGSMKFAANGGSATVIGGTSNMAYPMDTIMKVKPGMESRKESKPSTKVLMEIGLRLKSISSHSNDANGKVGRKEYKTTRLKSIPFLERIR